VLNYALGATSVRLPAYALPSAGAAALYSCLFAYLGSAADDLVDLLNGSASSSLGAYWMLGGTAMAIISAWGMAKVCHHLLASPEDAQAAGEAVGSSGGAVTGRAGGGSGRGLRAEEFAPVAGQHQGRGGGAGGAADVACGAGGKASGLRAVQLVVVAGASGTCGTHGAVACGSGASGEESEITPLYTIGSLPRQGSGPHRRASYANDL
jgi:hypothetical protein